MMNHNGMCSDLILKTNAPISTETTADIGMAQYYLWIAQIFIYKTLFFHVVTSINNIFLRYSSFCRLTAVQSCLECDL